MWSCLLTEHCKVVLRSGPVQYCKLSYFHQISVNLWNDLCVMQSLKMSQEAELRLFVVSAVPHSPAVRGEGVTLALHAALAQWCTVTVLMEGPSQSYLVWFLRESSSAGQLKVSKQKSSFVISHPLKRQKLLVKSIKDVLIRSDYTACAESGAAAEYS